MKRDGSMCVWCRRDIDTDLVAATTEHLVPRIKGGPSWLENEVAACRRCNGERGHRTPAEWIEECQRPRLGTGDHHGDRCVRGVQARSPARRCATSPAVRGQSVAATSQHAAGVTLVVSSNQMMRKITVVPRGRSSPGDGD